MPELPTGTVTFLFTDLETSTRLWEEQPEAAMRDALGRHDVILRDAIEQHRGLVFSTMGDGIAAAFASAADALAAAVDAQQRLSAEQWGETGPLRARIGLHTAEGLLRAPGEYVNRPLNRCARLMAIAHGGQILVSSATAAVARDRLPPDARLVDLGEHRLRDLAEPVRVFHLVHAGLHTDFPPLRSLDSLPGNLPRQLTTFVGRERELKALGAVVRERSLVTLTGVGGVGKTRLAVQVAADVAPHFPDGAWLCELAPVADPEAVWETLAGCLGVQRSPGREVDEVVLEYLASKRLLVVIDNCEHLLDAVASAVDAIAQRCPRVSVLATSREGLAIPGEQIVAVPSLDVPGPEADAEAFARAGAVHLFCDRARAAKNDFVLTEHNGGAVVQLCRRLDGIPLAIELAAARVRTLSPDDLVGRLDQRFRLLTRGSRAAVERQQTLRNTFDWSYDLLTSSEREALDRLSVFAGGCDLAAAEAVLSDGDVELADAVDVLSQLVDKSLVVVVDDDGTRYRLLESIRQYAQERLEASGDASTVRRRHADHFVAVSEAAGPHLRNRDQLIWAAVLERDTDNFRAALDWAVETRSADHALRLVAPLLVTGITIGWTATDWAETASAVVGARTQPLFPLIVAFAALRAALRGELERAAALVTDAREAQDELGTRHLWVHAAAATLAYFRGDYDATKHEAEIWVEAARRTGDPYEIAQALIMLTTGLLPDPERAVVVIEEAVRISRDAGIASALSYSLMLLASLLPSDEHGRALALLDEAVEVHTKLGDPQGAATAIGFMGILAERTGDCRAALRAFTDAAEQHMRIGESLAFGGSLWGAAFAFGGLGHLETAAVLFGLADARFSRFPTEAFAEQVASTEAAMLEGLGELQVAQLKARGAALDIEDALAYLRTESDRALTE